MDFSGGGLTAETRGTVLFRREHPNTPQGTRGEKKGNLRYHLRKKPGRRMDLKIGSNTQTVKRF